MKLSKNHLKCEGLIAQISPSLELPVFIPTGETVMEAANQCLRARLITPFVPEAGRLLFVWTGSDFFYPPYPIN